MLLQCKLSNKKPSSISQAVLTSILPALLYLTASSLLPCQASPKLDPELSTAIKRISDLVHKHDYDGAAPVAETTVARFPQSFEARMIRADVYKNLEEDEKAIADYNWVLSAKPKDYRVLYSLADLYYIENKLDLAMSYEEKALACTKSQAENTECYYLKVSILKRLGRTREAEAVLNLLLHANPESAHFTLDRLKMRIENSNWKGAVEDADFCLPKMPLFRKRILQLRAKAYLALKRYDEAEKDLKTALSSEPTDRALLHDLVQVYKSAGKADLAAKEQQFIDKLGDSI